ncbi:MAG: xylanase [Limisphaerales bacterium]|nr:MAG: xylanase [Limisphaerales bacterium]KAG0509805.1 MAG: xylanase [Limisphaerales bacterium]TXT50973.1 MAG: xylanase [Limisphaerales bacterium]
MQIKVFLFCALLACSGIACRTHSATSTRSAAPASTPAPLPLWPKQVPGETAPLGEEKDTSTEKSNKVAGKPLIRLGNVSQPTLTVFRPAKDKDTGAAVIVCPGGGYNILAYDLEGSEICEWLNSIGVTGVLLKYRVPKRPGLEKHTAALQDAQRAVGLVRSRATELGLDPKRIGILGFSAGGHLAATACNNYEKRTYEPVDDADKISCRPDFAILIYPAYLTVKEQGDKVSPELPVTANTPQTFLVMTQDDGVRVESALFYYLALKQVKVPAELHLYPTGGHGYGLRPSAHGVTTWPKRAAEWMQTRGLLAK